MKNLFNWHSKTISKEQIIKYFKSGIKEKKDFRIGIEHEKFLFNSRNNKRIDYQKIKEMFSEDV